MSRISRSQRLFILGLCALSGVLAYFTYQTIKDSFFGVTEEAKAIFSNTAGEVYKDIEGRDISLESYLGKSVIVATSWASWSPFSATDLLALDTLATEMGGEVVFLAINRKETKEQALRYLTTIPKPNNIIIVLDEADRFYNLVGGYAMPETVIFAKDGEIILHDRGVFDSSRVRAVLAEELVQ